MIVSRLDTLFLRAAQNAVEGQNLAVCAEDYRECTYLFQTISEIISALSHNGWIALLNNTVSDRSHDVSLTSEGEFLTRTNLSLVTNNTCRTTRSQNCSFNHFQCYLKGDRWAKAVNFRDTR